MRILLTLIAVLGFPLAEIATFIAVGSQIGVGWTLLLIVASSILGVAIVRRQSLSALQAVRAQARTGHVPEREIVLGAITVFAGLLLVVPGFITSAVALFLLLPPVREALWTRMKARVVVRGHGAGLHAGPARPASRPGVVDLEADEFERQDEAPRPASPWREIEADRDPRR